MKGMRPAGGGLAPDRSAAAVVHYFTSDPLRMARADRIVRDLALPLSTIQPILDHLVALGVLDRRSPSPTEPPASISPMSPINFLT